MKMLKNKEVINAVRLGTLCSISYLAVYFARNMLSAISPQMIEDGICSTESIGSLSSAYFIFYAVGQLINGAVGEKIKSKYMISLGLIFAGISNALFYRFLNIPLASLLAYGMTGFFLSMIYAPMTKVVAENTTPLYAMRCSLGYTFSSFLGSPLAGFVSALLIWNNVFHINTLVLLLMGAVAFAFFTYYEKKGIVKYYSFNSEKSRTDNGIKLLLKNRIIKFTLISVITGIIRTTVVFWMPTYFSQYLGFSAEKSAYIFTIATLLISATAFIAVFIYEHIFKYNMDNTIFASFILAAVSFLLVYLIKQPIFNIIFIITAIMSSNSATTMLWSIYCPSLKGTGMVSTATGFLDFMSYVAASASSTLFANSVDTIGWGKLILVWFALMIAGVIISLPTKKTASDI